MEDQTQQNTIPPVYPQQSQLPVPPTYQPKQFGWLKWVLIILVVALLSSTTTYFIVQSKQQVPPPQVSQTPTTTPTPDETANWKVYTNTVYGFSLKYPPDYQVKEERSPVGLSYIYMISIFSKATPTRATHVPNIGIYVYTKGVLTLRQLYEQNKTTVFNNSTNAQEIVINGIQVLQFSEVPTELGIATAGRHVLFGGEKYIVDVTDVAEGAKENPVLQPIYDHILSTFQFTD